MTHNFRWVEITHTCLIWYPLQMLMFKHTFCSQYQWFDRLGKQTINDKNRDAHVRGYCVNRLRPHDALKHHFTSLKTDLIFLQPRVLNENFRETDLTIHGNFLKFLNHFKSSSSTTSRELRQQFAAVVDEDDKDKFRPQRVYQWFRGSTTSNKNHTTGCFLLNGVE